MSSSRRSFLARATALAALVTAAPRSLLARAGPAAGVAGRSGDDGQRLPRTRDGLPVVPRGELAADFWRRLRSEFLIPPGEAFFNTGTMGSSPRVVLDAVIEHMTHVDRDVAHWDYKDGHENYFTGYYEENWLREKIARLINAEAAEIALTQNATIAMNFFANGLPVERGDEVVAMEGAHPGGRAGWQLRDKRYGVNVRWVEVPMPPESPEQLVSLYEKATTDRTRVWAIPHLTSATAVLFPVEEMCRRARQRGIITVIDGAQTFGHLAIDVRTMGCDAFFTSPHKWLLAPKGTGFLYVRKGVLASVWPTLASGNYDNQEDGGFRLMQNGTGNLSLLRGLGKACDFHANLGPARVEARVVGLADRLRAGLRKTKGVRILSPLHRELRSATTVWTLDGVESMKLQDTLWDRARVRVRRLKDRGVRQCCHIYNLEEEVDRTLETVRQLADA